MAAARRATANPLTAWLKSWAEFTWVKDTTRSPIRLPWVAINWAVTITLPVVLFYHRNTEPTPTVIGVVAVVWLLWTIIRAAVVVPARNKATARVYAAIRGSHRLPTLTASRPVVDPNHLTITRWHGLADPWAGVSTYTDGSKAATLAGRGLAEQDIERGIKPAKNKTVIFDWEAAPQVQWTVVAADDPRAKRRDTTRWINQVVEQLFPKARGALGLQMEWPDTDDPHGDVPAVITVDFGAAYSPDSSLINDIESQFDNQFRRGVAWLYDWTVTGTLTITAGDPDSSEAARQTLLRWWRTEVRTRAEKAFGFRNLGSYTLTVTDWDDTDTPTRMSVEFDGGSIDPDQTSTFLTSLDVAFDKAWPDRIWLDDWAFGHTTRCTLTAVPPTHEDALRKTEERRLRGAVAQKFTTGRGTTSQVGTEVDQWRTTETGTQKPTRVVINFGTLDVNSFKFRLDAETHLDSLYPDTGWAYQWDTGAGTVTLTEVPALPRSHLFPLPGTPDFDRIIEAAKTGVITFGTAKGGGEVFMDLNRVPHALVGGITRSGKALDVATSIPTPTGWTRLGDLQVGHQVFDEQGQPCTVTGVFDQPDGRPCYRVTFSDGTYIVADAEHLWLTEDRAARLSRFRQRTIPRGRQTRVREADLQRLRVALEESSPSDTITIPDAAALAGLDSTSQFVHAAARHVGATEEVVVPVQSYRYSGATFEQMQRVSVYALPDARRRLLSARREPHQREALAGCLDGAQARGEATVTALSVAAGSGVERQKVRKWLSEIRPVAVVRQKVPVVSPDRVVTRLAPAITLYPKQALLSRLVELGEEALWDQRHLRTTPEVRTTKDIAETLLDQHGYVNHTIRLAGALETPVADLPIPPYTLGVWLGDGSSWHGSLTTADPEMVDLLAEDGTTARAQSQPLQYSLSLPGGSLRSYLRHEGLWRNKHIPPAYLRASQHQRQALLAGLLDTDGTVAKQGTVQFDNTNRRLIDGVVELARSLGYRPTIREKQGALYGVPKKVTWRVSFTTSDPVFRLTRKRERHAKRSGDHSPDRTNTRSIVSVEPVESVSVRCITVDSANRLFLAGEGMIPTHNSVMLTIPLMYALYLPDEYDLVVCDPKRTDFTWTAEFPNVRFAATTEEITAAVKWAQERMSHNQDLLNRYQREKVDYLHQMASEGKIPATDAPKRTLVFFDEMAAYFDPSKNEDVRVLQSEAQYALSQIMMMGAAMWVNVIGAAQKPSDQNLGTQIRELFGTRIGIGWMKGNMSTQVLGDNRAEKLDRENTPKGRGWVLTEGERDKLGQVWYLPKHAETIPWIDGAPEMPGVVEIVAARLFQLGYRRMEVPGPDGVMRYRWVKPDELAIEP